MNNQEFNEGDLVEASKGERSVKGRLVEDVGLRLDAYEWSRPTVDLLIKEGFTLALIEKATPELPTESGWYTDKSGQLWSLRINGHGEPEWFLSGVYYGPKSVASAAPFTRLEPVADTAKKVTARILELHKSSTGSYASDVRQAAQEFGVTS